MQQQRNLKNTQNILKVDEITGYTQSAWPSDCRQHWIHRADALIPLIYHATVWRGMNVARRLISNQRFQRAAKHTHTHTHTPCTAIGWFQMCATLIRSPSLHTHLSVPTTPQAAALSPSPVKLWLDTNDASLHCSFKNLSPAQMPGTKPSQQEMMTVFCKMKW